MFPIVQNLNNLASSLNSLRMEVHQLKVNQTTSALTAASSVNASNQVAAATVPVLQQQVANLDEAVKRVSSQNVQAMQNIVDVKRQLDSVKSEVSREVGMLEAMILRKCEVTMHKMINDKISVALDAQRSGLKDRVAFETRAVADGIRNELAHLRTQLDAATSAASASNQDYNAHKDHKDHKDHMSRFDDRKEHDISEDYTITIGNKKSGMAKDAAPVDAAPVDAAPVDAAPVDAAPVDAAPVDAAATPAETPIPKQPTKVSVGRRNAAPKIPTPKRSRN